MMAKSKIVLELLKIKQIEEYAATTLQLWYRVASRVRARKRTRAGRKIYKFLKLVKAEVDAEIRKEEKRRKIRQKMRNRTKEQDDAMLETAWEKMDVVAEEPARRRKDRPSLP